MSKAWDKLTPFFEKSKKLGQIISILNYDISTNTPEDGIADESDILNDFMTESAKISTDPDYIAALEEAVKDESLTPMQKKVVREAYKDVEIFKKMPMQKQIQQDRKHRNTYGGPATLLRTSLPITK